jgi:hypothetical protein
METMVKPIVLYTIGKSPTDAIVSIQNNLFSFNLELAMKSFPKEDGDIYLVTITQMSE